MMRFTRLQQLRMIKFIFLLHRYLGIALGVVISLWCLSGFVMMYVQFPDLSRDEQLAGLDDLDLASCCALPDDFSDIRLDRFRVETMAGRPVLRLSAGFGQYVIDLVDGEYLVEIPAATAHEIADRFSRNMGLGTDIEYLGLIERDQWTVYGGLNPNRPLYHFRATDPSGTEWYVSAANGEVIQMTTARERFWNWAGSVTHWIYPTILRQHTGAWLQVVIWLTILGLFLTVVGLYIGIRQFNTRRRGRPSPYRGALLWHHYSGLIFGLLTLTWLFSGLLSVNAFGAFESRSFAGEVQRLRGGELGFYQARGLLGGLATNSLSEEVVRLEGSLLDGEPQFIAWDRDGGNVRLDVRTLEKNPLPQSAFETLAARMRPDVPVRAQGWLNEGDAYFYSHHDVRSFPVYRVQYEDGERFYLDEVSGQLAFAADSNRQWSRWLFLGLHRGDFFSLIRARPIWDLLLLPLLAGVTFGALTGTWMGFRRLTRRARA